MINWKSHVLIPERIADSSLKQPTNDPVFIVYRFDYSAHEYKHN